MTFPFERIIVSQAEIVSETITSQLQESISESPIALFKPLESPIDR